MATLAIYKSVIFLTFGELPGVKHLSLSLNLPLHFFFVSMQEVA